METSYKIKSTEGKEEEGQGTQRRTKIKHDSSVSNTLENAISYFFYRDKVPQSGTNRDVKTIQKMCSKP